MYLVVMGCYIYLNISFILIHPYPTLEFSNKWVNITNTLCLRHKAISIEASMSQQHCFRGIHEFQKGFQLNGMLLLIMYTCIYHDVDVRNSIGITFSHSVGCLIVMHTIPHMIYDMNFIFPVHTYIHRPH